MDFGFTTLAEWEIIEGAAVVELFYENFGKFIPRITVEELGIADGTGRSWSDDIRPAANARIVVRRCWWRYFWSVGSAARLELPPAAVGTHAQSEMCVLGCRARVGPIRFATTASHCAER
jgi:hypothetical protein